MKLLASLLVFLSATVGLAAADTSPLRLVDLATNEPTGDTIGRSTLSRSSASITANVRFDELPRGVYTVWIVTRDQDDLNPAPHVNQGGSIVLRDDANSNNGNGFDIDLQATNLGDSSITCASPGFPPFTPLANLNAEVRIIVVDHGIPDDFDNIPEGWITNFWDGQAGLCGGDCGSPPPDGTGWCTDYAAAIHRVNGGATDDPHSKLLAPGCIRIVLMPPFRAYQFSLFATVKKWDGTFYDYMGACDLKLVQAPNFGLLKNQTLDVDIRTKIRYDYSFIESAAIKIGQETLEVGSWGDYSLNGVTSVALPAMLSGYRVTHETVNDKTQIFTIHLGTNDDDEKESILVKVFKDWVSVKLDQPSRRRFHGSVGMMGELETGRLLARDGVTVLEDPNAVAAEWQIRDDEPMLFRSTREPQYPQECKLPSAEKKPTLRRRLGESVISREEAKAACEDAAFENLEGCIHDVMVMGDLDLVATGAF